MWKNKWSFQKAYDQVNPVREVLLNAGFSKALEEFEAGNWAFKNSTK
jgi:hypothetical protein